MVKVGEISWLLQINSVSCVVWVWQLKHLLGKDCGCGYCTCAERWILVSCMKADILHACPPPAPRQCCFSPSTWRANWFMYSHWNLELDVNHEGWNHQIWPHISSLSLVMIMTHQAIRADSMSTWIHSGITCIDTQAQNPSKRAEKLGPAPTLWSCLLRNHWNLWKPQYCWWETNTNSFTPNRPPTLLLPKSVCRYIQMWACFSVTDDNH